MGVGRELFRLGRRGLLLIIGAFTLMYWMADGVNGDDGYRWDHASAYGAESVWDGGYWSWPEYNRTGRGWLGYYYQPGVNENRTSWGWHCALPEHLDPSSPFYSWAVLTPESRGVAHRSYHMLGETILMRIPDPSGEMHTAHVPVTDAGPFGVWWSFDLQDGLPRSLGWGAIAPSRYGGTSGPYFGRRDVEWKHSTTPRYCPRWGYTDLPPAG